VSLFSWTGAALALLLATVAPGRARADSPAGGPWTSGAAAELTRQGKDHVVRGNEELAVRRFVEAIEIDPTFGPAYLELGAARERAGDFAEAERTYNVAIEHVPQFLLAFSARAALLHRMGRLDRELSDLETIVRLAESADVLRDLARRYVEDRAWPAALATWRRMLALEEKLGDERAQREATIQIRALVILCAELDPVAGGASSRDWVRRAEASVARRRGM
jgi:tetratricopeptide (TPR) repeat protein